MFDVTVLRTSLPANMARFKSTLELLIRVHMSFTFPGDLSGMYVGVSYRTRILYYVADCAVR